VRWCGDGEDAGRRLAALGALLRSSETLRAALTPAQLHSHLPLSDPESLAESLVLALRAAMGRLRAGGGGAALRAALAVADAFDALHGEALEDSLKRPASVLSVHAEECGFISGGEDALPALLEAVAERRVPRAAAAAAAAVDEEDSLELEIGAVAACRRMMLANASCPQLLPPLAALAMGRWGEVEPPATAAPVPAALRAAALAALSTLLGHAVWYVVESVADPCAAHIWPSAEAEQEAGALNAAPAGAPCV